MNTSFKNRFISFIKHNWLFISSLVLTVILLSVSTHIVVSVFVPKDAKALKVQQLSLDGKDEVTTVSITGTDYGDFFNTYSIKGGAFCETDNNRNRKIKVGLKSEKNIYEIDGISTTRVDVYYMFNETKKLANGDVGFECEFSTLSIADGEYDIYVYVKENEQTYGYAYSECKLIKHGSDIAVKNIEIKDSEKLKMNIENGTIQVSEKDNMRFHIEKFVNEGEQIIIHGWGVDLNSQDMTKVKQYLELVHDDGSSFFAVSSPRNREDIAKAYGEGFLSSGMITAVDSSMLKKGNYTILQYSTENEYSYVNKSVKPIKAKYDGKEFIIVE